MDSKGIAGFSFKKSIQPVPILLGGMKKIIDIAAGGNHALAISKKFIYSWGCGEQGQLARDVLPRHPLLLLNPSAVQFEKGLCFEKVACGSYHSMATTHNGQVYCWGLNNYAQLGHLGLEEEQSIYFPTLLDFFNNENIKIKEIKGGEHHSVTEILF